MNEPQQKPAPKQAAKPPIEEGAIRVRSLTFATGINLPSGIDDQQAMRMSEAPRPGKPSYAISFLPRVDKYLVRVFPADRKGPPSHTLLIPGAWAVAEFAE